MDMFLSVTGYLSAQTLSARPSANSYLLGRILRIYPSLSILLLTVFSVSLFIGFYNEVRNIAKYYISSSFLITNFHLARDNGYFSESVYSNPFYHLWSISLEFQSWLVIAGIMLLPAQRRSLAGRLLGVLSLIFTIGFHHSGDISAFYLNPALRFWEVWVGWEAFNLKRKGIKCSTLMFCIAFIYIFAISLLPLKSHSILWLITPLLISILLMLAHEANLGSTLNKIARYLSCRTYSYYLWHVPIICMIGYFLRGNHAEIAMYGVPCLILFSEVTYQKCEKSFR